MVPAGQKPSPSPRLADRALKVASPSDRRPREADRRRLCDKKGVSKHSDGPASQGRCRRDSATFPGRLGPLQSFGLSGTLTPNLSKKSHVEQGTPWSPWKLWGSAPSLCGAGLDTNFSGKSLKRRCRRALKLNHGCLSWVEAPLQQHDRSLLLMLQRLHTFGM